MQIIHINYAYSQCMPGHVWLKSFDENGIESSVNFGANISNLTPGITIPLFVENTNAIALDWWFASFLKNNSHCCCCSGSCYCYCTNNCADVVRGSLDFLGFSTNQMSCFSWTPCIRHDCCGTVENTCCCIPTLNCTTPRAVFNLALDYSVQQMASDEKKYDLLKKEYLSTMQKNKWSEADIKTGWNCLEKKVMKRRDQIAILVKEREKLHKKFVKQEISESLAEAPPTLKF